MAIESVTLITLEFKVLIILLTAWVNNISVFIDISIFEYLWVTAGVGFTHMTVLLT